MPSKQELLFSKTAIKMGLISPNQMATFLKLQQQYQQQGYSISLIEWLLKQQYLTPSQISRIQEISTKDASNNAISLSLAINSEFAHYKVIRELGQGGMGKVFLVYDNQLRRYLALKILLVNDKNSIERFMREARAIAKLKHPGIVSIYYVGEHQGHYFYTMDYVDGMSLKEMLAEKRISSRQTAEIVSKVADILDYAHQQGIVHRDIKPSNIMFDSKNNIYIMDFGLAKVLNEGQISRSGALLGTLHYMAPEQADGRVREIDCRTDIYALGVTLYEMLTGKYPFTGKAFSEVASKIVKQNPTAPKDIKKTIPTDLNAICLKAMEKTKENRYQTAALLSEDLQNFLHKRHVNAHPKKKWLKPTICIFLCMLVLGIYFSIPVPKEASFSIQIMTRTHKIKKLFYTTDKIVLSIHCTPVENIKEISVSGKGVKSFIQIPHKPKNYYDLTIVDNNIDSFTIDVTITDYNNRQQKKSTEFFVVSSKKKVEKSSQKPAEVTYNPTHYRIFESSSELPPQGLRKYNITFAKKTTRYIYFEINFENLLFNNRPNPIYSVGKYYTQQGKLLGTSTEIFYTVATNVQYAYITSSWGWAQPGFWPVGNYFVEIYLNNTLVAKAPFSIN